MDCPEGGKIVMIKFTVPGTPVGKARARVTRYGAYTPEKTVNYETLVKEMFAIKYPKHEIMEGPLKMEIRAFFPIPKSTSKKKAALMATGEIRPTKKPDTSNILKIIEDALNKIAYNDDSQIVSSCIDKYYIEDGPYAEVVIKEIQHTPTSP